MSGISNLPTHRDLPPSTFLPYNILFLNLFESLISPVNPVSLVNMDGENLTRPAGHSCAMCHQRKVKCDKKSPCSYCVSRGIACVPVAPIMKKPRKRRFPEAELLTRLRRYEEALRRYNADIESIDRGDLPSPAAPSPFHFPGSNEGESRARVSSSGQAEVSHQPCAESLLFLMHVAYAKGAETIVRQSTSTGSCLVDEPRQ